MAIDVQELRSQPLDPEVEAELVRFEDGVDRYLAGEIDDDAFRVFRLNQGIYGQRQGGHNQMLRVKIPYGKVEPEQLEMLAHIAESYSRGWGHLTTRQNTQFHFVQLEDTPEALRLLASVGLTSREACGDTVRNVAGCHLAGACPYEVLDISPWAEATKDLFLRNPIAQRMPRKFKINFSGCATDCGQAMFNDVGIIAVSRPRPDGTVEPGFRVFMAGGLGANPHPALALEEFTSREDLLPTIEAMLRVQDHHGNRDNKLRARMKWLVDTMGEDELRERIVKERKFLPASSTYPGGIPRIVEEQGDAPAGMGTSVSADGGLIGSGATPVQFKGLTPLQQWDTANVVRGRANGTVSAYAYCRLGDITTAQFRALAQIQRDFGVEVRITNRQNFALRGLTEEQLPDLHARLAEHGMAEAGAELARDVVSCPGADTCNLAVTQSRGLAADIGDALEKAGLAEVGGVRINISGCTNSCGQHHVADIGFLGLERRAHGRAAPGYQMELGGHVTNMTIAFGKKATKLPAKRASEAVVRVVEQFAGERDAGETFSSWLERAGGAAEVGKTLVDLDEFPTPEEAPDYYVDFDETGPYVAEVGDSECRDVTATETQTEVPDLADLARVSAELEQEPASSAIKWAWETFGNGVVLAASFQDCVLIDIATQVVPELEIVFLDTQYHFAETLWYVEQVRERYDLNLRVVTPQIDPDNLWQIDPDECCAMRKVEPLARALEGKSAWLTGLRRDEAPTRANAPIVGFDVGRGIVKVNPIASWTHDEIDGYVADRGLPVHPLREKGYPSIGCWPCTKPVKNGDDPRAGRWSSSGKLECGLHGWTPSAAT